MLINNISLPCCVFYHYQCSSPATILSFSSWLRLFCFLVLPLFCLYNCQEIWPVSLSPPAGHWLHPSNHHVHEGLHAGTLRHQSKFCCQLAWSPNLIFCPFAAASCKRLIFVKVWRLLYRFPSDLMPLCCLQGTMCQDCLYSSFCVGCSWCQMSREMKKRNIQVLLIGAKNTWSHDHQHCD